MGRAFLVIGVVGLLVAFGVWYLIVAIPGRNPAVREPASWALVTLPPVPPSAAARPGRPSLRGLGWQVVDYLSAPGVLVVTIHTHRMEEASAIAVELIDPLKDGYAEVLVYFHRPHDAFAEKRVQWSLRSGFVETDLGAVGRPTDAAGDNDVRSTRSKGS